MILRGNLIWTSPSGGLEVRRRAYLAADGEKVAGVWDALPPEYAGQPVEDWGEAVIIPAFCDLHIHAPQFPNRGVGYGLQLLDWLEGYTFPMEARFGDADFAGKVWKAFLNRLWAGGTLRFSAFATVHSQATWRLMELAEASGLRGLVGKVNMDRNSPDSLREDTGRSLADTEELICRAREELKHTAFILTPRFVPSTTERLMDGLGLLGEKYDLPVQSHLAENPSEVAWVRQLHPDVPSYAQVYERHGLLRRGRTIMAHCIYLSPEERALLKEREVTLAHCPASNADLASGIMPLRQYLAEGQRCCVASDVAGGHTAAMNRNAAAAVALSRLRWLDRREEPPLTLAEALWLITGGPGSFLGRVGAFEPGYAFDALVIRPVPGDDLADLSPEERLEQFLYDGDDRSIAARYCAGRLLPRPFDE